MNRKYLLIFHSTTTVGIDGFKYDSESVSCSFKGSDEKEVNCEPKELLQKIEGIKKELQQSKDALRIKEEGEGLKASTIVLLVQVFQLE